MQSGTVSHVEFVPLSGELVNRLLGRSRAGDAAVASGELAVSYLPPDAGAAAPRRPAVSRYVRRPVTARIITINNSRPMPPLG